MQAITINTTIFRQASRVVNILIEIGGAMRLLSLPIMLALAGMRITTGGVAVHPMQPAQPAALFNVLDYGAVGGELGNDLFWSLPFG
jgi:hypothetical protein